jgi:hypothetical protein
MFYYETFLKLLGLLLCLFFLSLFTLGSFALSDVIDLGEIGFSCPLDLSKLENDYAVINKNVPGKVNLGILNPSYESNLVKHNGPPSVRRFKFKEKLKIPLEAKIFVFSCYDQESIKLASQVNFDYGLCIEYKSLVDIENFRQKTGIKQPVQTANDQMVNSFKITSYPGLITVKSDEIEIQEGL